MDLQKQKRAQFAGLMAHNMALVRRYVQAVFNYDVILMEIGIG
jgi:hypothetical protein